MSFQNRHPVTMKIDLVRRYLNGEKRADLCRETGVARSTMWGWVCTWDFVEIKRQCQEAIRSSIVEQTNETVRIFAGGRAIICHVSRLAEVWRAIRND